MRGWVAIVSLAIVCMACGLDCPDGTRKVGGRCEAVDAGIDSALVDAPTPDVPALDTGADGGGSEMCNGADDDGDGRVDEGLEQTFYLDSDGDGFGDPERTCVDCAMDACPEPGPWVIEGTDCADDCTDCAPGLDEICDDVDNDCDDDTDEGALTTFYRDADDDDFGDDDDTIDACSAPEGYVATGGDCNDDEERAFPGQTQYFGFPNAVTGFDWNCNGSVDYEIDESGPVRCMSGDCPTTRRWVDSSPACGTDAVVWYCDRSGGTCGSPVEEIDSVTALCR